MTIHTPARGKKEMYSDEHVRISTLRNDPNYKPDAFFDLVLRELNIKSPYQLEIITGFKASVVSRVSRKLMGLTPNTIMFFHDLTGIPVKELMRVAGMPSLVKGSSNVAD